VSWTSVSPPLSSGRSNPISLKAALGLKPILQPEAKKLKRRLFKGLHLLVGTARRALDEHNVEIPGEIIKRGFQAEQDRQTLRHAGRRSKLAEISMANEESGSKQQIDEARKVLFELYKDGGIVGKGKLYKTN
jgi:hypothetical protein